MATVPKPPMLGRPDYPTSDGKPMAETDLHRELMASLIATLDEHFRAVEDVYVSGNLLLFYEPGNRRRHVSPDVFVVRGVRKGRRLNYILWEEGRGPDVVIELTSSLTRREDTHRKFALYRDVLAVPEYFLFDPYGDHLDPPLQGYRLRDGEYGAIRPVRGRLPSRVLGLHLEPHDDWLRVYNPLTRAWLPTPQEAVTREKCAREAAEQIAQQERTAREAAEAQLAELQAELNGLRNGRSY